MDAARPAPGIAAAYLQALPRALTLLTEQLATGHDPMDTRCLLATTAALKGQAELGKFLNDLDIYAECQACGEHPLDLSRGLA